jgi:hypothetical protein
MMNKKGQPVSAGNFYEVGPSGMTPTAPRPTADAWVCRRVADYPGGAPPAGAAVAACTVCGAAVAHGPWRFPSSDPPKVCMQCASITPGPISAEGQP